ncbi:MAG TPA: catalase family protein [Chloroflexota bacterium]|nr:catalase family protein [Chloroflexota bacterium]
MGKDVQPAETEGPRRGSVGARWPWKGVALLGLLLTASVAAPKVIRSDRVRGPGYGMPAADTGNLLLNWISDLLLLGVHLERRIDPFLIRPIIDKFLRDPVGEFVTRLINMQRTDEGYKLAEERIQPDEEAHNDDIIASFDAQMRQLWNPGYFERGGNSKTHGIVRAEFTVRDDLPEHLRRGIFATPATYKAWVRYSGPGPYVTPDIDDVGFMSMAIKLMGVPGPKLMDDEKFTQDMFGTSAPTFVSPDTRANAQLQHWSLKNAQVFYFFNPKDHHILDTIMQLLWTKTQTNPLEDQYFSCVPYLLGEGQAMQYSFKSRMTTRTPVPRLPFRPPDNYLRDAMAATLAKQDVEFDIFIQVQTDPFLMPIENAAVMWPTRLSPRVPAAVLRIPRQTFDSPDQLAFARKLTYNPFHSIPEHRPLGNVSRARQRMYWTLAQLRLKMNATEHYEPTGDETF